MCSRASVVRAFCAALEPASGVLRCRRLLASALLTAATFSAGALQAASPDLKRLTPTGGQRGTEVEVRLEGARLGDAQQIVLYDPGLTVVSLTPEPPNAVKAKFAIAPDCRLGMHPLRVRTASGLSDLQTFAVGALPETPEVEPNNDFSQPQKIAFGTTVTGVIKNEDVDYFAVEAKQGERIIVEIEGIRLGYTFFDPYVAILNAQRFELCRADDSSLLKQDGVAALLAPEDGTYLIQVRESSYDGNDSSFYRLHVGHFPRPTAVVPSGGRPGETLQVRWLGDIEGERVETVTLPSVATADFTLFPHDDRGFAPSGLPFRLVDLANVVEAEPNDSVDHATAATAPVACNGVIQAAGDVDHFRFHAVKGQQLDIRIYARALGSPLDAVVDMLKARGGRVGGNDDSGGPDSYFRYSVPEDADYVIAVRDHLKSGGDDYAYRVEITPTAPSLVLGLPERVQYIDTTIAIPQGGYLPALVSVKRTDFSGDVRLEFKDLPPGVTAEAFPCPASRNDVPVLFKADEHAALASSLTDLTGTRSSGGDPAVSGGFLQKTQLVYGQNRRDMWVHYTRRIPVAVTQAAPFKVDIVEPKVPLVRGGSMSLKLVATRQPGFTAPINVRTVYNPPGVGTSSVTIPEGQTEALLPVTATNDAELNKWPIAVLAEATVGDGAVLLGSPLATLEVAEQFLAFTPQATAVEQGKEVEMPIAIEKKKDFEGVAKIELVGTPNEVTADPLEINKDTTQLTLKIKTTAKSPAGRHKTLICRTTVMANGEPIVHMLPAGELRIDTPLPGSTPAPPPQPGAVAAASPAAEKRLSRLEKLRLERQEPQPVAATGQGSPAPAPAAK